MREGIIYHRMSDFMIKWQIGDCIDLLGGIPKNTVDFMVTDPPYGVNYVSCRTIGENPHGAIQNDATIDVEFNRAWLASASNALKPDSAVMVFTRWDVWNDWVDLIAPHWDLKNMIVWAKNNHSAGDLTGNLGSQHELIIFAARGDFKIHGRRYSNLWQFGKVPPTRHPTEKPVPMIRRAVELCTEPGDTVLDPFLGSGTTMEACYQSDRGCIGYEIDGKYEKYYTDRATKRKGNLSDFF